MLVETRTYRCKSDPKYTVNGRWSTLEQLYAVCLSVPLVSGRVPARSYGQTFVKLYELGCIVLFQSAGMISEVEFLGFKISHMYRKPQLFGKFLTTNLFTDSATICQLKLNVPIC